MKIKQTIQQDLRKFGLHIRKLRENRRITTLELSKRTGIRKEYIQKIEEGTAKRVLLNRHIVKIARALDVAICEIFDY